MNCRGNDSSKQGQVRRQELYLPLNEYREREKKKMNELYEMIEKKIKDSGYPGEISGRDVYEDICDQIDDKENGGYLLLSKFEENVTFEYQITVMDEEFNLVSLTIRTPEEEYHVDFDN